MTASESAILLDDEAAFADRAQRHRRELHVHCYRMLASFDDAEDAVQETLLRAWRGRAGFDGSSQFRAWLYRIATNVCLDMLRRRSRQSQKLDSFADLPWLQPYPDRLLDEVAPSDEAPDAVVVERETIELTFLAALQVLPPRQRAALIARDVLGWPAVETAALMETSVPAARCRRTSLHAGPNGPQVRHVPPAPRSASSSSGSSMRTSVATPQQPSRSRRRTFGSRCRPT
jgi:RNA polymerase sigma-70 factor (TIGR02960 family)